MMRQFIESSVPAGWTKIRRAAVVLGGFALLSFSTPSRGWEESLPTVILFVTNENADRSIAVAEAVEAQLGDLPVTFRLYRVDRYDPTLAEQESTAERIAGEHDALAVIWCEIKQVDRVYFYLATVEGDRRILVRRVDSFGEDSFDPEVIAIIARESINALLEGGEIGIRIKAGGAAVDTRDRHKTPIPLPVPLAAEPTGSDGDRGRLAFDAAYRLQVTSTDHPASHGASLALRLRVRRAIHGYLGYSVIQPIEDERSGVLTTVTRHPLYVGALISPGRGRLRPGGTIAFGVDFTKERHRALDQDMEPEPGGLRIGASVRALALLDVRLVGSLSLFVALGAEAPLNRARYVVNDGTRLFTVFEPWPVQPLALVGFDVELF